MEIKCHIDHFNINVTDLARSIEFYEKALGMKKCGELLHPNGDYIINYLQCPGYPQRLELTWLRDHEGAYELGENESHLAFRLDEDNYEEVHQYHKDLGIICYENPELGIYFINDPDDYWVEILKMNF